MDLKFVQRTTSTFTLNWSRFRAWSSLVMRAESLAMTKQFVVKVQSFQVQRQHIRLRKLRRMLCIFFNTYLVVHYGFIPQHKAVDTEFCCNILRCLRKNIQMQQSELWGFSATDIKASLTTCLTNRICLPMTAFTSWKYKISEKYNCSDTREAIKRCHRGATARRRSRSHLETAATLVIKRLRFLIFTCWFPKLYQT